MRVVFDTNVVLDLLLDREPWSRTAADLFARVEIGTLEGFVCATTVTTIYYLAAKTAGRQTARREIRRLMALCAVAPVHRPVLEAAMENDFADFEDAVIYQAARHVDAAAIVTRDATGFKKAQLPILSPDELTTILTQGEDAG